MADEIMARARAILAANEKDLAQARSSGLSSAMIDRLHLNRPVSKRWPTAFAKSRPCPIQSAK